MSPLQVTAEDTRKLQDLETAMKAARKELEKLQQSASGLHEKASSLQQEIEAAGGEPLRKKKDEVKQLQAVSFSHPRQYWNAQS